MIKFSRIVFLIILLLALSLEVRADSSNCYYIQIGSFSNKQNVIRLVKQYAKFNEKIVVREVRHSKFGFLYQVLVGPFISWKEADSHKIQLRKKGIYLEDAFIVKISHLVLCNPSEHKGSYPFYYKEDVPDKKPEKKAPIEDKDKGSRTIKNKESEPKESALPSNQPPSTINQEPVKESSGVSAITAAKASGRNIIKGRFAVSLNHASSEFKTELDQRFLQTSDGSSTDTTEIDTNSLSNNEYYTLIHRDTIRFNYGVTDYLEIFADVGAAYHDVSKIDLTYGGGARLNIFQIDGQNNNRYYGALSGEAFFGSIEYEYDSDAGDRWNKEADWQEISAKFEIGVSMKKLSAYAGGAYTYYLEKANLSLLSNLPASVTSYQYEDELSADTNLGVFGGIDYHFTEKVKLNLEGQAGNPEKLTGTLQYEFK